MDPDVPHDAQRIVAAYLAIVEAHAATQRYPCSLRELPHSKEHLRRAFKTSTLALVSTGQLTPELRTYLKMNWPGPSATKPSACAPSSDPGRSPDMQDRDIRLQQARRRTQKPCPSGMTVLSIAVAVTLIAPAQAANRALVPSVESWAPGVFDEGACPSLGTVTYRIDATVLLPLLVTAVPVTSRADVGIATFAAYDCAGIGESRLRALEFFAGSFPERARGLNRLGFLREVVRFGHSGPDGTAHFGVITANREESVEQAKQALDQHADAQPYTVIDGRITPGDASNTVTRMTLRGRWTDPGELYRTVQPIWATTPPTDERTLPNVDGRAFGAPVGFLGALQISLHALLGVEDRPSRRVLVAYVHNGRAFALDASAITADRGQTRTLAQQGVVSPSAVVHRITYRILDDLRREVETFRVWVERPAPKVADPLAPPLVPVAFEFRPRSFLELRAVRAAGACGAAQAPPDRARPCDAHRTASR